MRISASKESSAFNQHIAEQLNELFGQDPSIELTVEFLDEYLEPSKVANEMAFNGRAG